MRETLPRNNTKPPNTIPEAGKDMLPFLRIEESASNEVSFHLPAIAFHIGIVPASAVTSSRRQKNSNLG